MTNKQGKARGSPSLEGIREVGFNSINMWVEGRNRTQFICTLLTGTAARTVVYSLSLSPVCRFSGSQHCGHIHCAYQYREHYHCLDPECNYQVEQCSKLTSTAPRTYRGECVSSCAFLRHACTCLFTLLLWKRRRYVLNLTELYFAPI